MARRPHRAAAVRSRSHLPRPAWPGSDLNGVHGLAARPHAGGRSGVPSPPPRCPTHAPKTCAENHQYRSPSACTRIPARVFSVRLRATAGGVRSCFGHLAARSSARSTRPDRGQGAVRLRVVPAAEIAGGAGRGVSGAAGQAGGDGVVARRERGETVGGGLSVGSGSVPSGKEMSGASSIMPAPGGGSPSRPVWRQRTARRFVAPRGGASRNRR